jgi:hypothetical protein
MVAEPTSRQELISVLGLVGLEPDLVRASNAAWLLVSAPGYFIPRGAGTS